jgi:hypothetical protein
MAKNFLFILILSGLLLLLMSSPFAISNDGRHYLSAAEALKEGGIYASLGRSASAKDLSFLDSWPPVYSMFIAAIAFLSDFSVAYSAKIIALLTFLLTSILIWKNFRYSVPIWGILGMILFVINSGHYYSTAAEIFLVPVLLFLFWRKDFFIAHPFILGLLAGILYLIKYSFLFVLPTFFLYLLISTEGISTLNIRFRRNLGPFFKRIFFYLSGFLMPYCIWHYIVYKNNEVVYKHFSNPVRETVWYQYFRDLIISWNIFPERFEYIALYPGVVFFAAVVTFIFYDIYMKVQYTKRIELNQFFWHIPLLGMLMLFLLVAVISGSSTKRYLEYSDFFLFVILFTSLTVIGWNRAYRYLALGLACIQILYFLRINIPKIPTFSFMNMRENILYQDINKRFAEGKIEKLYVNDLSFSGAVINYEYWDKIEKLRPTEKPAFGEKIFFMVQKEDLDKIELPNSNIIYINR